MKKKTTIEEVVNYLDTTFHPELQEDYDNSGFLLGDSKAEFKGALVALDLTPAVVDEVLSYGDMNLIVTHHPFIFSGLKRITDGSETGRMVMKLVKNNIAVYAAHTNLDNLPWGVSGVLAERLGLKDCHILKGVLGSAGECEGVQDNSVGAGMVGELPRAMEANKFLLKVKELTGQPLIRTSMHDPKRRVKRVALCGGSGAPFIGDAIAARADVYLTADLKYHDFQRPEGRIILADAGHYETEQFAKEIIFRAISEKYCNFAVRISLQQGSLVRYI